MAKHLRRHAPRAPPGHSRHAHPSDPAVGTAARPWHRPGDPRAVRRPAQSRNRLAVSRAAPAREARLAEGRVGRERGQPAGEVLPADGGGKGPAVARARSVVAARRRDRTRHESGGRRARSSAMRARHQNDLDDEIRGHIAISIEGADRARRGSGSRAPGGAEGIRQRHADPRFDARRLAPSLVRRRRGAWTRHPVRPARADARQRPRRSPSS